FGPRPLEGPLQLGVVVHLAHASPAAAGHGLDHDGIATRRAKARAASTSGTGPSVAGTTGRPAASARRRDATLSPNSSSCSGVGPMKAMPADRQRRANSAFSAKNP